MTNMLPALAAKTRGHARPLPNVTCTVPSSTRKRKCESALSLDMPSVLFGRSCQPPCFRVIVPGQSST
jgi:hypothetical protein